MNANSRPRLRLTFSLVARWSSIVSAAARSPAAFAPCLASGIAHTLSIRHRITIVSLTFGIATVRPGARFNAESPFSLANEFVPKANSWLSLIKRSCFFTT